MGKHHAEMEPWLEARWTAGGGYAAVHRNYVTVATMYYRRNPDNPAEGGWLVSERSDRAAAGERLTAWHPRQREALREFAELWEAREELRRGDGAKWA